MKKPLLLTALAATALLASSRTPFAPRVAEVGGPLPENELEGFAQTQAESLDDYYGRAILIEFFAYW